MRNTSDAARGSWAAFIREGREERRLTKTAFADRIGVDRGTVHRWETGKNRTEDVEIVERVAEVFETDLDDALVAAGMKPATARAPRAPRAPMDPDLLILMRVLADPATDPATVAFIRHTLQSLANLPPAAPAKRRRAS